MIVVWSPGLTFALCELCRLPGLDPKSLICLMWPPCGPVALVTEPLMLFKMIPWISFIYLTVALVGFLQEAVAGAAAALLVFAVFRFATLALTNVCF